MKKTFLSFHLYGLKRIDSWEEKLPFKEYFGIFKRMQFWKKISKNVKTGMSSQGFLKIKCPI